MIEVDIRPIGELDPPAIQLVLATAVDLERDAVLERMRPLEGHGRVLQVPWDESTYFLGRFGMYDCALVLGDAGSDGRDGAHQVVADAISRWKPLGVIMPGIAFGIGGKNQIIGDVLVSTKVCPYDHKKVTPEGKIQRGPIPEAGQVLLNRVKNLFWTWTPKDGEPRKPLLGPILSGNTLVNDPGFKAQLLEAYPEAIGGEMEGAGLYGAAERKKVEWLIVKGICDWGENKRDDDQPFAAANASDLVRALLSQPGLDATSFNRESTPAAPTSVETATRALTFSQIQAQIRSAHDGMQQALQRLEDFVSKHMTLKDGKKTIPKEHKERIELLQANVHAATETWLNAYNDAAARYTGGDIDPEQFLDAFGEEVLQIFRSTSTPKKILEANAKAYEALLTTRKDVLESRLTQSSRRLLETFKQFGVGVDCLLPFGSLQAAKQRWSRPEVDGYPDALVFLLDNGLATEGKNKSLVLTALGYEIVYSE